MNINLIKERFERYFQYLSDDNAEKTYYKLYDRLSWDMQRVRTESQWLASRDKGLSSDCFFHGKQVIVSLTTYGKRLYDVFLTIESIMQQTVKPNRIILWLQDDLKTVTLPITLQHQVERGLEIGFCKDIKSYKKLIPTLTKYPDDIIVTIDDDVIFAMDMLENLLRSFRQLPQYIHTNRAHIIRLTDDGTLAPYIEWEMITSQVGTSPLMFPTGGGGTLYPPHSLSEEVLNEEAFMSLSPKGDDIWFKAMSLLKGTQCYRVATHEPYLYFNPNVQDMALWNENIHLNDVQLKYVFAKYGLYEKLR